MDIEKFFDGLADRFWKENSLSDVTYALCMGSPLFLRFFVDFFFHDFNLDAATLCIEREFCDDAGNRPDFRVTDKRKGVFYIEIKIWDRNQHFESYVKSLHDANNTNRDCETFLDCNVKKRLGYVAAYPITVYEEPASEGCVVRTWEELYKELQKWSFFEDNAIRAYGKFLVRVCGLQQKLDLDSYRLAPKDFLEIREFVASIDSILESQGDRICRYNGTSRWFRSNTWMGRYFEWKKYAGEEFSVWGWFGVYFGDDTPQVYVWFEDREGWGKPVCDHFRSSVAESSSIQYVEYDKSLYIWMTKQDNGDLAIFFKRALDTLECKDGISSAMPLPKAGDLPEKWNAILAMRRFPMCVERWFQRRGQVGHFRIASWWREENPCEYCRIRFQIETKMLDISHSINGWVGMTFDGRKALPTLEFQLGEGEECGRFSLDIASSNGDMTRIGNQFWRRLEEELENRQFLKTEK